MIMRVVNGNENDNGNANDNGEWSMVNGIGKWYMVQDNEQ